MPIGFSDHSVTGLEQDLLAVAMGATIVEKHFSLSRDFWGADHQVSLTPGEFSLLVEKLRELDKNKEEQERIITSDYAKKNSITQDKKLQDAEVVFRPLFRKTLVAGSNMTAGTVLTPNLICAMRPQAYARGLPSEQYVNILGKKIKVNLRKYDPISREVLG